MKATLDSHASTPSSPEITCSFALLMVGLAHVDIGADRTGIPKNGSSGAADGCDCGVFSGGCQEEMRHFPCLFQAFRASREGVGRSPSTPTAASAIIAAHCRAGA